MSKASLLSPPKTTMLRVVKLPAWVCRERSACEAVIVLFKHVNYISRIITAQNS